MKIMICGADGKLGQRLAQDLSPQNDVRAFCYVDLDIERLDPVIQVVREIKPHAIINAAAFTAVDRCEDEIDAAYRANAVGVRNLAIAADSVGARLVHFSTDFVFDGERSGPPYREYDTPNPLSVYGKSKLAGEREALQNCGRGLVLRLAWVYGPGGWNFTDWVLEQAREEKEIRVVTDQIGTPTWTGDVARQVARLLEEECRGLYHSTGGGECSRYDWACEALRLAGLPTQRVIPVTSEALVQKAPRPRYSVLDNFYLRGQDLDVMRDWREALREHLNEAGVLT